MIVVRVVAWVALAAWVWLALCQGGFWRTGQRLPPRRTPPRWPSVAVVVPARDEADVPPSTLPSLLAQRYPGAARVILVDDDDDGGGDGTAAVAERLAREHPGLPLTVTSPPPVPPGQVVAGIAAGLAELTGGTDRRILGAGIGVPGIVRQEPSAVVRGQTVGWDGVSLEELLRAHTGLPLFVDNGAATMGQAEMGFGSGRTTDSAVFLLIGSGAGASLIADGALLRGSSTSAGEWGHTNVEIGGRLCRCGARGRLEAYVGAEAVIARYLEADGAAALAAPGEENALGRIVELAGGESSAAGDAARQVLDETALRVGVGIANLVNLLNPKQVIIGGWAGLAMAPLLPRIREAAREHSLRLPFSQTSIQLGALGPDAVARGAATLPVAAFLASGGVSSPAASRTPAGAG